MHVHGSSDLLAEKLSRLGALKGIVDVNLNLGFPLADRHFYKCDLDVISGAGFLQLCAISHASRLKKLVIDVSENPIGDAVGHVREFRAHPNLTDVCLDFSGCGLGDDGLRGISELKVMPVLKCLCIDICRNHRITHQGIKDISDVSICPTLVYLRLVLYFHIEMAACLRSAAHPALRWEILRS